MEKDEPPDPDPPRYREVPLGDASRAPPLAQLGSHPLLFAPARLAVSRLRALRRFPGLPPDADLFLMPDYGHPVRRAEVVGVVVGCETRAAFATHFLDDGTGVLPCVTQVPKDKLNAATYGVKMFEVGTLVRVAGFVSAWDGEIRLNATEMRAEENPQDEAVWWLTLVDLDRNVYSKGWEVMCGLKDD